MRISIVTPVRNDCRVKYALRSIFGQDHEHDLETVVINAGKDLCTRKALDEFHGSITYLVNEEDEGKYHGMNKGIDLCTGDVVGILNADDRYFSCDVLQRVAREFDDPHVEVCYGDLVMVDEYDAIKRHWKSGNSSKLKWRFGWMPPHPTFFVRRSLYESLGKFDTELAWASDYELMMRYLFVHQVKAAYIGGVLVRMALGGASNTWEGRIKGMPEMVKSCQLNGMSLGPIAFGARIPRFAYQYMLPNLPGYRRKIENCSWSIPITRCKSSSSCR